MKQYQISINQQTAATLDELEAVLKIPRAKIIQKGLVKLREQFARQFVKTSHKQQKSYKHFDKYVGSIKLDTKEKTNYALTVDDIYVTD